MQAVKDAHESALLTRERGILAQHGVGQEETIQEMGVGEMIKESEIEDKIIEMLPAVSQYRKAYQALPEPKDGAFAAAEIILSMCN